MEQQRAEPFARPLAVSDLGVISYADAWSLQRELVTARTLGQIPDTLLLLEHPHTFTCGRLGGRNHILASDVELNSRGVTVLDVDRGGDVTYHGPGQLVAYPIINLAEHTLGRDFHGYVRALEGAIIDALAHFSIRAHRVEKLSGAWVTEKDLEEKIAAIGVKVDGRSITSHGIALNVNPDLSFFNMIVPCGISDKGVTSMSRVIAEVPSMDSVKSAFARSFAQEFEFRID